MTDTVDLKREVQFATGAGKNEKNWKNQRAPLGALLALVKEHKVGAKDGLSITQGPLVAPARTANNVAENYILMVDVDTGASIDKVEAFCRDLGLFAVIWTTHSHMKTQTLVPEQKLVTWMRQKKRHWDPQDEDIRAYFAETAKMAPKLAKTCRLGGKQHVEGGVKFVVTHDPMPRFRVLFVLSEPFSFSEGGTQRQRIDKWKELYAKFSDFMGVGWDRSCVDPSRLMYTPRCAVGDEANHEVRLIEGEYLDLARVEETEVSVEDALPGEDDDQYAAAAAMYDAEQTRENTFATPGLLKFVAEHGATFAAAEFMAHFEPDGLRNQIDGGYEFRCPNADGHTNGDDDADRAFMVKNGEENNVGTGFHMGCLHDTCKTASNGDRLWYLDKFMVDRGLTIADALPFCSEHVAEQEEAAAREEAADTLYMRIMGSDGTEETREQLLAEMARLSLVTATAPKIVTLINDVQVREKLGARAMATFKELFAAYKRVAQEEAATLAAAPMVGHALPDNPETARVIWKDWDHEDKLRVARAVFMKKNKTGRHVYANGNGDPVYIVLTESGISIKPMDLARWSAVLGECMSFKAVAANTGVEHGYAPFMDIVQALAAAPETLDLPVVLGVSEVPVFGEEGNLLASNGYDAANKVYIHCPFDIRPVSAVPSEEEVDEAISWIMDEALRDFPFSDSFNGDDVMPLYVDDGDGGLMPNWERGRVSRLHAMLMILQPFARNMIAGNAPAFHIDKATRGTGASYLANVPSIILTGAEAIADSLPNESKNGGEETVKKITTQLLNGNPIVFWDNINHKVDSGALARAITSTFWRDRILGGMTQAAIRVTNLWLFAGNNVSFSDEIYRRLIPIRLDANRPDPENRPTALYKHYPLAAWLMSARRDLVWACHTLIQNWIAKGKIMGSGTLASFETWAGVMTGIVEAAGLNGALSTIGNYKATSNDDAGEENSFVQWWHDRWKYDRVGPGEMVQTMTTPGTDGGLTGVSPMIAALGLDSRNDGTLVRSLGYYVKRQVIGKTARLADGTLVKAVKAAVNPARYQLVPVAATDV